MIIRGNNQKIFLTIFAVSAFFIPLFIALGTIIVGNIPFWYDPARDFLLALDNLQKPTLIGPTAGIPGIFYGPYWIWLLSAGLLVSKDPRIVVFLTLTLPYFVLLPLIFTQYRSVFDRTTLIILWILFIMMHGIYYATQPWNPNPAPLLLFLYICVVLLLTARMQNPFEKILTVVCGFILGFIINFHISLGIGVSVGTALYFVLQTFFFLKNHKKEKEFAKKVRSGIFSFLLFAAGFFVAFLPFFLFEIRHGFQQTQVVLTTLSSQDAVVGVKGMEKAEIARYFLYTAGKAVGIIDIVGYIFGSVVFLVLLVTVFSEKIIYSKEQRKLFLIVLSLLFGVFLTYIASKNPVWSYHFIGLEVLVLLLVALCITNLKNLKYLFILWALVVLGIQSMALLASFATDPYKSPSLATKEHIVRTIIEDAGSATYMVFAYSPSIYTYDFSYLFGWIGDKNLPYNLSEITEFTNTRYLIIPKSDQGAFKDFVNYRTPDAEFRTVSSWKIADGTTILKREKFSSQVSDL